MPTYWNGSTLRYVLGQIRMKTKMGIVQSYFDNKDDKPLIISFNFHFNFLCLISYSRLIKNLTFAPSASKISLSTVAFSPKYLSEDSINPSANSDIRRSEW